MGWCCQLWQGVGTAGGDTGLRLGHGRANKHSVTLQPGWAQKALSVWELTKETMQQMSCCD